MIYIYIYIYIYIHTYIYYIYIYIYVHQRSGTGTDDGAGLPVGYASVTLKFLVDSFCHDYNYIFWIIMIIDL